MSKWRGRGVWAWLVVAHLSRLSLHMDTITCQARGGGGEGGVRLGVGG